MDYLKPAEVMASMIETGTKKGGLAVRDLLVRGALSGGNLGIATTLAITAAVQTSVPLVGAIIFPVGFVMIVLLGLELVTGSFALLPLAQLDGRITFAATLRNWGWSFLGNLLGSMLFALLAWGAVTMFG
ncbi:MAG TPA: formate/nitrite transporter family protein, partial [Caldimonas sp.]|nr:formate/nitrite transporter family protein [Caldimonas sp.]